jgi:hypothetical protein
LGSSTRSSRLLQPRGAMFERGNGRIPERTGQQEHEARAPAICRGAKLPQLHPPASCGQARHRRLRVGGKAQCGGLKPPEPEACARSASVSPFLWKLSRRCHSPQIGLLLGIADVPLALARARRLTWPRRVAVEASCCQRAGPGRCEPALGPQATPLRAGLGGGGDAAQR